MSCQHPEHRPPMGKTSTLVLVDTKIEGDKLISIFEYTCPGCAMRTRSSHVSQRVVVLGVKQPIITPDGMILTPTSEPEQLDQSDIKIMLNGLIKRDVSVGEPLRGEALERWKASPEGRRAEARDEARKRGDLMLITLSEPGSIKWLEVDRTELRRLVADGWVFDDKTMAWANEEQA